MLCKKRYCIFSVLVFIHCQISSAEKAEVDLGIDLRLSYIDKLQSPLAKSNNGRMDPSSQRSFSFVDSAELNAPTRTLGLRRFLVNPRLKLARQASIDFGLRLDAANREAHTEDSRAGDVYFASTQVELLDWYIGKIQPSDSVALSIGVFEKTQMDFEVFEPGLDFGLTVKLPERVHAAAIDWRNISSTADVSAPTRESGLFGRVVVFGSGQDRGEELLENEETQDNAPSTSDPHTGALGSLSYQFWPGHKLGLLLGQYKSDDNRTIDDPAEALGTRSLRGLRSRTFVQFGDQLSHQFGERKVGLGIDYRAMTESWRSSDYSDKARHHTSTRLALAVDVPRDTSLLLAYSMGSNKVSDENVLRGSQMEFGVRNIVAGGVSLLASVAAERRETVRGENVAGSFAIDGKEKRQINRFCFELSWKEM